MWLKPKDNEAVVQHALHLWWIKRLPDPTTEKYPRFVDDRAMRIANASVGCEAAWLRILPHGRLSGNSRLVIMEEDVTLVGQIRI
jgi:hypothetical protein